ncbi:hypothetical protein GE061_005765 [Apolygus lucorum]|uniref:Uncharacterized protein n=1 Tax=Apolygus lucorum TaxID=248454 RepID=A0A8S9WX62_APOLU|nr:hypothetical protein GE061_005765 [Apolygus lucorum]
MQQPSPPEENRTNKMKPSASAEENSRPMQRSRKANQPHHLTAPRPPVTIPARRRTLSTSTSATYEAVEHDPHKRATLSYHLLYVKN